jgi:hypothetical protein
VFTFIESNNGFDDLDHSNAIVLDEYDLPPDQPTPEDIRPPIGDGTLLKQYELPPGAKMIELDEA